MTSLYELPENLKKSKDLEFGIIHGKVIKSERWTETNVEGGGVILHFPGNISHQKRIKTTSTNLRHVWIEKPDGRQAQFIVDANKNPFAEGHLVTIVTASRKNKTIPVYSINYTLDNTFSATGKDIDSLLVNQFLMQLIVFPLVVLFIAGFVSIFLSAVLIGILLMVPLFIMIAVAFKMGKGILAQIENVTKVVHENARYEDIKAVMEKAA